MKKILTIYLILLFGPVLSEENASIQFCFYDTPTTIQAANYLNDFLIKDESLIPRRDMNCLDVLVKPARANLFEKLLASKFSMKKMPLQGNESISDKRCDLVVEKETFSQMKTGEIGVRVKSFKLKDRNQIQQEKSKSFLVLMHGKTASLHVNEEEILVKCFMIRADRYQLEFYLKGQDNSLSSTVSLVKGQRLEVGGLVKTLNSKDQNIDLPNTGITTKTKGERSDHIWLMIK